MSSSGQPIRLTLVSDDSNRNARNPFDSAVMPGRSLAERITRPDGRSLSPSPPRRLEQEAARKGIDRYVPSGPSNRLSRSRSPQPAQRRGGRRLGTRREGGGRDQDPRDSRGGRNGRPKKTQEELDAEMADYFGHSGEAAPTGNGAPADAGTAAVDDVDMIE